MVESRWAINTVMAGCPNEAFPIVLAAVEAACAEEFAWHGLIATTYPAGPTVVVSGPLAEEVDDFLAVEQPVEIGVNGRVARSGEPAMVNDTRLDSDYLSRNPRTDPGSELSLPISVAGSIWGVMNLEQEQPGAFAEEDLLLAHVVASQVGAAIHRCQLVEELEVLAKEKQLSVDEVIREACLAYTEPYFWERCYKEWRRTHPEQVA